MWKTIYPSQGEWYHIRNLANISEVFLYLLENYGHSHIVIISVCHPKGGKPDMRKWAIKTQGEANHFQMYCQNSIGVDDLKVRVRIKAP